MLYLIWHDPWMTIAPDTYISATLAPIDRHTQPETTDQRHPEVDLADLAA